MDEAAMETFSRALAEETGALPPPHIVVEAIRESQSADARIIGNAVRAYYRRRRPRPAMGPPPQQQPQAQQQPEPQQQAQPQPEPQQEQEQPEPAPAPAASA
jgi:hypothetical protein